MYTCHIIYIFNPICIFKFSFKRTLTSFKFFFSIFKTHIVNLIKFFVIKIRLNILMWFLHRTYLLIVTNQDFIHCNINNIIILLLTVKFISWYGIFTTVLIMSTEKNTYNQSLPGPCIHLMNAWGHVWDRWVWTYPLVSLNICFCACQHSH